MKKSDLVFTAALVPLDYLMIILAGLTAYALRTSEFFSQWRPVLFGMNLPFEKYLSIILVIGIFWLAIFAMVGLYSIKRRSNKFWEEFFRVIIAVSAGLIGVVFYIFIIREWFDSRFLVLAIWFLTIFFVTWGRIFTRLFQRYLSGRFGFGNHNVVVIGDDGFSRVVMDEIKNNTALGYNPAAYFKNLDMSQIKELFGSRGIDEVILASPEFAKEAVLELVDFCEEKHIGFKFVPNLFQTLTNNVQFDVLGGVPVIELKRTALDGWGKIIKRLVDFWGAAFGIVIFSPFMLIVAILIKFDSPGPIIYKNERVGPRGRFNAFKFRSMKIEYCTGSEYDKDGQADKIENELIEKQSGRKGPVFKIVNDPRRTKLGRFLERTSLDELLQFFNVLMGDMSLVGPRPHMPKEVAKYEKWHKKVFNIKPGITGLAQISGRSEIDFDEEAKLDTFYIENWSLGLDFKILFKTPFIVISGKGHK